MVGKRIIPDPGSVFQHSKYAGAGPEKAGWCFPLCLGCRVESDLSHYMQLLSFQLFLNLTC